MFSMRFIMATHRRLALPAGHGWGWAMELAEREAQVRRFVEEVWNRKNYDAVSGLYGEGYVGWNGNGPAAKAEAIRSYHQAFGDLHVDVEEVVVAADAVVLRSTVHGTDTGGYAGRAPTGRATKEWVVNIMHFEGDRVVREFIGADKLGLFIELGVVDNPWQAGASARGPEEDV
jgi:predicted ester cyclase